MDFKNRHSLSRNIAMWQWNEKLNTENTATCTNKILSCGFGGFCISADAPLSGRYMGNEWMRNVSVAVKEASSVGGKVWICDENGGYSGTANGTINSAGLEAQQKFLKLEAGEKTNDRSIIFRDGYHFYYDVNPYYVDVFDRSVTTQFIEKAYLPYIEKFSDSLDTFLCTPPQISSEFIPWSFTFPAEYKKAYGEELLDVLLELFRPIGNYKSTRIKFWTLVSELFSENFLKPVYELCSENNISLAVNFCDNSAFSAVSSTDFMAYYEYSHIPCVKSSSRNDTVPLFPLAAASAAEQLGKKNSYSLILSNAGYGTTLSDYKRIAQQQLIRGVRGIITACESHSLGGVSKHKNTSVSLFHYNNFDEYTCLNNYLSRIGDILSEGEADFDTLLIHCSAACWGTDQLPSESLNNSIELLEKKHIPFHIGNELLMQKYAYVENDTLVIGNRRYKTVVLTDDFPLLESTTRLLTQFESGGGFITMASFLPSGEICDNENLLYTYRSFPEYKIHYFVNNSSEEFTAAISVADKMLNIESGDVTAFYGIYKFSPYESIVLIDDGTSQQSRPFKKPLKVLDISGEWSLDNISDNAILLDKCDVYFDDGTYFKDENCADVMESAVKLGKDSEIECVFKFNVSTLPSSLFLACENPDTFLIKINDRPLEEQPSEYFFNKAFSRIDISDYVCIGENTITLKAAYSLSNDFINSYQKALESPSELNRLVYPLEISPLYITGDFSVNCSGEFRKLDKNASRYLGDFSIDSKKEYYNLSELEKQGLVFFAGEITLSKNFNLSDTSYCLRFNPKGVHSITLEINGKNVDPLIWQPYECDISHFLNKGDNNIKITLLSNLRNLLGPHHIPMGELYDVHTGDFYKSPCVWNHNKATPWENNYCFAEFGITLE